MKLGSSIIAILLLGLSSCSLLDDKQSSSNSAQPEKRLSLSERVNEQAGFKQDADGKWMPKVDRRSSFEGQGESAYFSKKADKKEYRTGDFKKESWWGKTDYEKKVFQGDTDSSRFQKPSKLGQLRSREAGKNMDLPNNYDTPEFATNAANETRRSGIERKNNALIENERASFVQPDIIDWQEQRKLSVDQTKGLLGR